MRGFSYTEVLVATALIAIMLVPAMDALTGGIQRSNMHEYEARLQGLLLGRMEELLAKPYDDLLQAADAVGDPAAIIPDYSDAAGVSPRIIAHIARYDGDNADDDNDAFSGTDDDLLWVKVAVENGAHALESIVTR